MGPQYWAAHLSRRTLNTAGLGLDVLGAALLFFFAVSGGPAKGGEIGLSLEQNDPDEARAYRRHWFISRVGFLLIALGSALQIWSNYIGE